MIIGSAGYTAALCVLTIKINTKNGKIIITGASGGVGSIAEISLSNLGYHVTALSAKVEIILLILALKKLSAEKIKINNKPLSAQKWNGCIDTVGGDILANILTEIKYDGIVASTGLANSSDLKRQFIHLY